jgi:hypothetical protein
MIGSDEAQVLPPNLGPYTIGFAKEDGDRVQLFGSGTLVSVGKIEGILTAAHVSKTIKKLPGITLIQFAGRRGENQKRGIELQFTTSIEIGTALDNELGPDIAFIRLSFATASALKAKSSFANFQKHKASVFAEPPTNTVRTVDAVAGVVEEWQEYSQNDRQPRTTTIIGLTTAGTSQQVESIGNMDRLELAPLPSTNPTLPETYGGVSGGGLWRSFRNGKDESIELQLIGVAFYESAAVNRSRMIICHGPKSIYVRLANEIRKQWPDEFATDVTSQHAAKRAELISSR